MMSCLQELLLLPFSRLHNYISLLQSVMNNIQDRPKLVCLIDTNTLMESPGIIHVN